MTSCLDLDLNNIREPQSFHSSDILFMALMFDFFLLFLIELVLFFGCNRFIVRPSRVFGTEQNISISIKEIESNKEIFIIRGVPGAGKKHLIYHMERDFDDDELFSICDRNNYFITDGKFQFNYKYIHQANQQLRMQFINALTNTYAKRVYITGYFEEYWQYEEFIKLGELNNCKVRVIELRCPDEEHLTYFNKRGKTSPPLIKSKKCFENWEYTSDEYVQEPYIEPLEGDCIPKYNSSEIEKSDKDFNNYINGECAIESDDEFDNSYDYSGEDNGDHIEYISEEEIKDILENLIVL